MKGTAAELAADARQTEEAVLQHLKRLYADRDTARLCLCSQEARDLFAALAKVTRLLCLCSGCCQHHLGRASSSSHSGVCPAPFSGCPVYLQALVESETFPQCPAYCTAPGPGQVQHCVEHVRSMAECAGCETFPAWRAQAEQSAPRLPRPGGGPGVISRAGAQRSLGHVVGRVRMLAGASWWSKSLRLCPGVCQCISRTVLALSPMRCSTGRHF